MKRIVRWRLWLECRQPPCNYSTSVLVPITTGVNPLVCPYCKNVRIVTRMFVDDEATGRSALMLRGAA